MGVIEDWNDAINNDPYWQFEELLEEDPKEAERIWHEMRVETLTRNRLAQEARDGK
jgi:hypothetical protein